LDIVIPGKNDFFPAFDVQYPIPDAHGSELLFMNAGQHMTAPANAPLPRE
jgi:hypothetical protein